MKHLIVFTLIISIHTAFATARTDDPNGNCGTKGLPQEEEVSSVENLTKGLDKDNIKVLVTRICSQLQISKTTGDEDTGERIENHFLTHLGITRETKGYQLLITNFWNSHSQELICDNGASGMRNPQAFMKRAIDMGMEGSALYDFILTDEDEYPVTVNHVQIVNGKKETVLDYVELILTTDPRKKSDVLILL